MDRKYSLFAARDLFCFILTAATFLFSHLLSLWSSYFGMLPIHMMIVSLLLLDLFLLHFVLHQPRRHFFLLVFAGTYNLLLLGRVFVTWIFDTKNLLTVLECSDTEVIFTTLNILFISLFCIFMAYRAGGAFFRAREKRLDREEQPHSLNAALIPLMRQLSLIAMLISFVAKAYSFYLEGMFIQETGYLNSFVSHASVPGVISMTATFFLPAFVLYIATLPTKNQLILPFGLYVVIMGMSLLSGRRNNLVKDALLLLVYVVMRDDLLPKAKQVIKKGLVFVGGIFGLIGMYLLNGMRTGFATSSSFVQTLIDFVSSQGATFRVVMQTVNNLDRFDPAQTHRYLFFPIERFLTENFIAQALFGTTTTVETQTVAYAEATHNFAHVITYMVNPARYLSGGGFGTSFVAESFVAYGLLGVILISMLLGILLRFFPSLLTRSVFVVAFGLMAIRELVYIPRNFAFSWVFDTFTFTYVFYFGGVFLLAALLHFLGTHVKAANVRKKEVAL